MTSARELVAEARTLTAEKVGKIGAPWVHRSRTLLDEMADELDRVTGALERIAQADAHRIGVYSLREIAREALAAGRPTDRSETPPDPHEDLRRMETDGWFR